MSRSIEEIEGKIKALDDRITPLADERSKLKRELLELRSPFKTGDVIQWDKGRFRGMVISVLPWVSDPMWRVQNVLKDGSLGKIRNVYPYQNPKKT